MEYWYTTSYVGISFQEKRLNSKNDSSNLLVSEFTYHKAKPQITIPSSVFYS